VDHCKVKRAKIFVEWEVGKIIVNVEKEGVAIVLRWF